MPFFRSTAKVIYFAHVPKCGGSAVETYLRLRFGEVAFLEQDFYALPASRRWGRSSAQHIPLDTLNRLFPAEFFDASFAVVRHPVERLVSEYHFLRDSLRLIEQAESFSSWVGHLDRAIAKDPWLYDNHLRPMVDLVPGNATVFRLEDGLDHVISYLDGLVGACDRPLRFERDFTRDPSIVKVVPSADDIATIERLYHQDFERFGYTRQTTASPDRPAHIDVPAQPPVASGPRADRSALAARFRDKGIASFRDGNLTDAHTNFRFALNCAPDDARSHALIANTALRLGAVHLAMFHATKALDRQPGDLDALVALAGARLRLKHPKARQSVEALAPFHELGDFRHLLHIALSAAEDDDGHETALFDLAQYLEIHLEDTFASELLSETFRAFQAEAEEERFALFLDGVAVLADQTDSAPLDKPEPGQAASVDIIIPVYNAIDDLARCLASLRRYPSTEIRQIILVDDCSSPESAVWMADYRDRNADVHLIRNAENLGFTGAVMAGVAESHAPYMLFLNSDTVVTASWLQGMVEAMQAGPQTALVGPLSNNGYHQTIRPAPLIGARAPVEQAPDDMAAQVLTISKRVFPRVPFLSGFCLLVHRGAFDSAGGLDCEAFPKGYWEVQDLCLKLTDLGFDSVIADHTYVHHAGAGSIGSPRRKALISTGRARMYARYSSLRVLLAETVSGSEPEVARHRFAWASRDSLKEFGPPQAPLLRASPQIAEARRQNCLKPPPDSVAGREVCLFVTHCPLGAPLDYTLTYLAELKRAGLLVIVCLAVEDLSIPVADSITDLADGVILRENGGYDFGVWADALRVFPQVWSASRLYFANDSLLGPFQSLCPIIDSIREQDAGFFAASECTVVNYHAQSFFFGWNQTNLGSPLLREFWGSVVNLRDKTEVILKYELGVSHLSSNLPDPTQDIVFGFKRIFGCSPTDLSFVNPTHSAWMRLLAAGFPFVKTGLLRDGAMFVDSSDWETVCAAHGADVEAMHRSIETSRINRLDVGHVPKGLSHA